MAAFTIKRVARSSCGQHRRAESPHVVTRGLRAAVPLNQMETFEPMLPDPFALAGFGSVILLCVVAAYVWATQVVPVSRMKLARSKRDGQVREYLDDLAESPSEERGLEQWVFTDWLEGPTQRKEPALPILKKAKWNSGDNPVLAATAIIMLGVVFTSLTERVVHLL